MDYYKYCQINFKRIVIAGVGRAFFQEGMPISIQVTGFYRQDMEVSYLHVADELLKNGWTPERTLITLTTEFADRIQGDFDIKLDPEVLRRFCYAPYEEQRDMIFHSLFPSTADAKQWLSDQLKL